MNSDRKQRYMEYKYSKDVMAPRVLERLFASVEKYETRVNKDCCDFTSKEILTLLTLNNDRSIAVINNKFSMLCDYAEWCLKEGLIKNGKNHYTEIDTEDLKKCLNKEKLKQSIVTKKEVYEAIEDLPNVRDRFIILAIFELGVKRHFEDIANVKLSDFIGDNKLQLKDRTVTASDKLYQLAKEANSVLIYTYTNQRVYTLVDSEYVVKYIASTRSNTNDEGRKIMMIIRRLLVYMGWDNILPRDIALSGMLHWIKGYAKYYKIQPEEVVRNKKLYAKICNQYDMKTYYTAFLNQYGTLLTSK